MKLILVANTGWYLANFRLGLVRRLVAEGHEVVAVAPMDSDDTRLAEAGARTIDLRLSRNGLNPLSEAATVVQLRRIFAAEAADVVLSYTPKGTIYSALALAGRRERLVVNISGLGRAFAPRSRLRRLSAILYRHALGRAAHVFFENDHDRDLFVAAGIVRADRSERIPGLGVDLARFAPGVVLSAPRSATGTGFLFVGRLLWDKGLAELAEAARILHSADPAIVFQILGFVEPPSVAAVPRTTLDGWVAEGIFDYLGTTQDVRGVMLSADCIVLPSYYPEGVPRSLLEAAALGRPIVTTDSTGCRDAVDDGTTGYLTRPRDATDLKNKLAVFAQLPTAAREAMGRAARAKMVAEFNETNVLDRILSVIEQGRRPEPSTDKGE